MIQFLPYNKAKSCMSMKKEKKRGIYYYV